MFLDFIRSIPALWRFRSYRPRSVTPSRLFGWLYQFPQKNWRALANLLRHVVFVREDRLRNLLVELNDKLVSQLQESGIPSNKLVYVQIDEAGSSSGVILNMLRDAALLQSRKATLLDSKNVRGLNDTTTTLEDGAIIYVDDFSGSGEQFCASRDFAAPYIFGNFSEFFLLPYVCEEALQPISERGVVCVYANLHKKSDRPLLRESQLISSSDRDLLCGLCQSIQPVYDLGFRNMATMVVFYSNSPDSTPLVLRGNPGQHPSRGILPRTTDL
jgi:hypothetical protein